jgi:hypothetical protein
VGLAPVEKLFIVASEAGWVPGPMRTKLAMEQNFPIAA